MSSLAVTLAVLAACAAVKAAWHIVAAAWSRRLVRLRPVCAWLTACWALAAGCNAAGGADMTAYVYAGLTAAAGAAWVLLGQART